MVRLCNSYSLSDSGIPFKQFPVYRCVFYFSYNFITNLKVKIPKMLNLVNELASDWVGDVCSLPFKNRYTS